MDLDAFIANIYEGLTPHLNERQIRIFASTMANSYGRGGVTNVSKITGMSRSTINIGRKQLDSGEIYPYDKVRSEGAGRKKITEIDPELINDLDFLIEPTSRGDPESPLRWTCLSTRNLAEELINKGHNVSHTCVSKLLNYSGYSLQAPRKTEEGKSHEDRNEQFEFINEFVKKYQTHNQPVISVDCKKKENIGNYTNKGQEWRPKGKPVKVKDHDFIDKELGKAIPYGIYDISNNSGWVNVGVDHETSEFAVESIRRWWITMGQEIYPNAESLLITADSGGSNGYRRKAWKVELQKFCDEFNLMVSVCHFPPGTSKWNKIEHRLFSAISKNWRGRPLINMETIVNLIANTRTSKGLTVQCSVDNNSYPLGRKVSKEEMNELFLLPNQFHGEWNYTIAPKDECYYVVDDL
ncbi:ISAzo13 family transposase [Methanoplanus endosymbiosus]|uniref:ISAzo13 family transposase n=1 Tax=Methanoplanus endosymbiosus TaxID=33865 RepID=A0A9E7TGS9_9EURY|nr:ISAzo13 family transposase [Methanoplanus endosymbiosus]UUX91662.1 ISAzo13 family transposase [Methanoplanus endosymbiosus]